MHTLIHVWLYVYIHTHRHVSLPTYICIYMHTTYMETCTQTCIHTYGFMHDCQHIYIPIYVQIHMHTLMHIWLHTYIYIFLHCIEHICMHSYINLIDRYVHTCLPQMHVISVFLLFFSDFFTLKILETQRSGNSVNAEIHSREYVFQTKNV